MNSRASRGRRRIAVALALVALLAALSLASAGSVAAAPAAPASCAAHEAEGISPPGTSEEFPGGMPQLREFIGQEFPGVAPGQVYSAVARLHEGSHEACDAALE